ncbi:TetR/AcrR family transcriptional regulator [Desulfosporosinus sp. PR]|uniref:TetR/AcrR family transcriptional regulator n=1 Tax=Candidatus Desulfosporosinus nitrosoreducens TaxID=3401928 RepID=UPI002800077C|nr:TetR/AcrR family transcriptional regulator [Desulfosporosinus sp. PR]MDQ7097013.1 TetR/AcrR family transcriptional regulator [Desulfosporosinus sp. PR]
MKLRDKQKAEVKSALIRAGEDLFKTNGFAETTIEEITGAAGVARGTFYNYFQTKEDLALEIFYESEELTTEQIDNFFATTPGTDNQIKALIANAVEWTLKKPELVLVTLLEKMKRGQTSEHSQGPLFRRLITEAFKRGQSAGVITRERSPQDLAHDIDGLYMVHLVRWYHYGQQEDLLSAILSAVNTYLAGAMIEQ